MKKLFLLVVLTRLTTFSVTAQTTYKDVAPVLYNKCTSCHNPNGIGPMPLQNYSQTAAYKSVIRNYILRGLMPPWPPDTTYHTFTEQRVLTGQEKKLIVNWIDSGAVKGDTLLAPPAPTYNNSYRLHGTPDLIVKIPTFTSNAASTDSYDCFVIPTGLVRDRIIRAYEIVPGNRSIVHHVIISCDTTGTATTDISGSCFTMPSANQCIGGYAPGSGPTIYPGKSPLKIGFRLKANSNIVVQIHYPAGTAGKVDSTSVRFFFYPLGTTGVRPIYTRAVLQNKSFLIQANAIQTFTAKCTTSEMISTGVSLYSVFPHQHKVGVSLVNYAFSGIDTIPLVKINNWDFRWQGFYTYPTLVKIPAGYTLFASHTYNNTTSNPNNPFNPPQDIKSGPQTTNEMLEDLYQYLDYEPGDDTINIANLLQGDSLMGVEEIPSFNITSKVYPNPFNNQVHIGYTINAAANLSITVYNIYGSKVRTLVSGLKLVAPGDYESVWDGKSDNGNLLPPGLYIYNINCGKCSTGGKIILER